MPVNATLSPSLRLLQNLTRQESVSPVGQQNVPAAAPEQAPAESTEATSPSTAEFQQITDEFEQAANLLQNFAAKFGADAGADTGESSVGAVGQAAPSVPDLGAAPLQSNKDASGSTPVLQQSSDTNCGATVATMLADGAGKGGTAESDTNALNDRFASAEGTTSLQLSNMLAHEGLGVKQAYGSVQQQQIDEALSKGQKIAAQVDSNRILPGATNATEAGKSHWVVVDGKDAQGNYSVKDPGTGKSYSVGIDQLTESVRAGWDKHNAGGVLIVEDVKGAQAEAQLAQEGADHASALGNGPGVGSDARATYGRESS